MARKVFLSFLGTNDYVPCNYAFGNETISDVRFVQEACVRHFCKDWSAKDVIFICVTDEAFQKNWEDNGHTKRDGSIIPADGLESRLRQIENLSPEFRPVSIPSGKSEEEIWDIFEKVFGLFQNGDELYLDITHAFRSIPMLAMAVLSYAKVMRNITVHSFSYGAMEALGDIHTVREMPVEQRNVPVFDLTPLASLQDWVSAVDQFTTTGDGRKISALSEKKVRAIKKATPVEDQDPGINTLGALGKTLESFSAAIQTCRSRDIPNLASRLKELLGEVREQDFIKPLKPLLRDQLGPILSPFTGEEINDGLAAARWCLNHDLYQQSFTILQETLITCIVRESTGLTGSEKKERALVGSVLASIDNPNWNSGKTDAMMTEFLLPMKSWLEKQDDLRKCMRNISDLRNDLNHAGQNKNPRPPRTFRKALQENLDKAEAILAENASKKS